MKNLTINGICSNCGECCSDFLHLDKKEIETIDNYLKNHKIIQQNKGSNNWNCPFRNNVLRKCEIYEVRPLICQKFKCNLKPNEAFKQRDLINFNKKPRSMAELFFNDDSKLKYARECGIPICRRNE